MSGFFIAPKYKKTAKKHLKMPVPKSLKVSIKFLSNSTQILIKFLPNFTIVKLNRFLIGISKN